MARMNWDKARRGGIGRFYPPFGEPRYVDLYSDNDRRPASSQGPTADRNSPNSEDASKRYPCPKCETRGTYAHNLRKHLMGRRPAGHGYSRTQADHAIGLIERGMRR